MSDQIIPSSQEVYNMYWGEPDRLPGNWMELDEIADKYFLTVDEVEELLNGLSWERRTKTKNAERIIWDFLTQQWGLEYKIDFEYSVSVGMSNALFYLHKYGIGINLDNALDWRITRERHNGSYVMFWVSPHDYSVLVRTLENFFRKYHVIPKRVQIGGEDD